MAKKPPKKSKLRNIEMGRVPSPTETKDAKFSRLATKRVNAALGKIKLIGNLAGPGYSYTPEQVEKIAGVLNEAVKFTMNRFTKTSKEHAEQVLI